MIEHGGSSLIPTERLSPYGLLPLAREERNAADAGSHRGGQAFDTTSPTPDRVDIGADSAGTSTPSHIIRRSETLVALPDEIGDTNTGETGGFGSSLFRFAVSQYNRIAALVSVPDILPGSVFEFLA